jgi:hypothetical protein
MNKNYILNVNKKRIIATSMTSGSQNVPEIRTLNMHLIFWVSHLTSISNPRGSFGGGGKSMCGLKRYLSPNDMWNHTALLTWVTLFPVCLYARSCRTHSVLSPTNIFELCNRPTAVKVLDIRHGTLVGVLNSRGPRPNKNGIMLPFGWQFGYVLRQTLRIRRLVD